MIDLWANRRFWLTSCLFILAGSALLRAQELKRLTYTEVLPNLISRVEPIYPEAARKLKIEGLVEIDAYVETDGSVYSTIIVLGDLKLTDAAEDAVKQWKFKPFEENGHPVRRIARIMMQMRPPAKPAR